jgi:hypothetical protein
MITEITMLVSYLYVKKYTGLPVYYILMHLGYLNLKDASVILMLLIAYLGINHMHFNAVTSELWQRQKAWGDGWQNTRAIMTQRTS